MPVASEHSVVLARVCSSVRQNGDITPLQCFHGSRFSYDAMHSILFNKQASNRTGQCKRETVHSTYHAASHSQTENEAKAAVNTDDAISASHLAFTCVEAVIEGKGAWVVLGNVLLGSRKDRTYQLCVLQSLCLTHSPPAS